MVISRSPTVSLPVAIRGLSSGDHCGGCSGERTGFISVDIPVENIPISCYSWYSWCQPEKKASVLQQQPATYITAQCPIIYQQSRRHSEMVTAVAQFQLKSGFLGALAAWIGRGAWFGRTAFQPIAWRCSDPVSWMNFLCPASFFGGPRWG